MLDFIAFKGDIEKQDCMLLVALTFKLETFVIHTCVAAPVVICSSMVVNHGSNVVLALINSSNPKISDQCQSYH